MQYLEVVTHRKTAAPFLMLLLPRRAALSLLSCDATDSEAA